MTHEQLDEAVDIRLKLRDLTTNKEKAEYAISHLETQNESARSFISLFLMSPTDYTEILEIKDVDFLKIVISSYIAKIETGIKEIEEKFKAL